MALSTPPAAKAPVPSTTLPPMAQRIFAIVDELIKVIEAETPHIRTRNYSAQAPLLKRKQELTLDYQSALAAVGENPALLSGLGAEHKAALKSAGKKLDDVSRDNAEALRLAHASTERLLSVIMNEVRKEIHNQGGYSQRGMLSAAESARARPVAYNQRV